MPAANQNHKLTIAYDGTAYRGWQRQKNGRSVQETIENALNKMWQEKIILHGSGRTDTGVHALGQVAHFHGPLKFSDMEALNRALNANLPQDIRILKSRKAPRAFHARFSATGKMYRYELFCHPVSDPFLTHRAWQMRRSLNLESMRKGAEILTGTHNFSAFSSNPGYRRENMVRTLYKIQITSLGPRIRLVFHGNGFLYKMARNLTGALVRVGDGRLSPEDVQQILESGKRGKAPPPAPAHGLYLLKVLYSS